MKAIEYTHAGGPEVLRLVERPVPQPGPGEVLVRVSFSGVNPTDWKSRAGTEPATGVQTPNQDGSGTIEQVGAGVDPILVGQRVWLWEAAYQRPHGTAAEYSVVPLGQSVLMGAHVPFEVGAALGVPFLTAHRGLTLGEAMPDRLDSGALTGFTVLVQGGAGAVGNAAIQLARWADATVIATVSSPAKAHLAAAAGADHVIDYRQQDVVDEIRKIVPHGVQAIVEVSATVNATVDAQVLALHGAVAMYAGNPADEMTVPIRSQMQLNSQWQFVLIYTEPASAKQVAIADVSLALDDGAIRIGTDAGLPIRTFGLPETASAHRAVEDGFVGKVLIDVNR